jgi:hypothetical protein
MTRKSRAQARQAHQERQTRTRGVAVGIMLLIAVALGGFFLFKQPAHNATGSAAQEQPTKPRGTAVVNASTTEKWTRAQGLPTQVMRLAFSASDPTQGYASAFVTKQEQHIYHTADRGATWSQVGVVQGPVSDVLSTDPVDPNDVVSLSVYAPVPGTSAIQRSLDGGKTWANQTTTLSTTGEVSLTGWSDSTFLVGIQLDNQLQGSSAVVAFPKDQASVHLDVNGKLHGASIAHLTLLTGRRGKVEVWGDEGSASGPVFAAATTDLGKNWSALPTTMQGKPGVALAASEDGGAIIAASADNTQLTVSSDDGASWTALPRFPGQGALEVNHGLFVTAHGKTFVVEENDGTYVLASGAWKKATSKTVSAASDGGAQHAARLWATDTQGHIVWYDA